MPREATERAGSHGVVQAMPQPLVISVPHSLGKEEAVRRLKSGLATAQSQFRQFFTVQEEIWSGDRLAFRVATLGQTASGTLDVAEDHVPSGAVSGIAFAEGRGSDPATTHNTADFASTAVLDDPLQQ